MIITVVICLMTSCSFIYFQPFGKSLGWYPTAVSVNQLNIQIDNFWNKHTEHRFTIADLRMFESKWPGSYSHVYVDSLGMRIMFDTTYMFENVKAFTYPIRRLHWGPILDEYNIKSKDGSYYFSIKIVEMKKGKGAIRLNHAVSSRDSLRYITYYSPMCSKKYPHNTQKEQKEVRDIFEAEILTKLMFK